MTTAKVRSSRLRREGLSQYILEDRWDKKRRVFCREFIKGCPSYLKIILDTVFNELTHYRPNLRNDLAEQIVEEVLSCRRNHGSTNPPFSRIPIKLRKHDKAKLVDYTKRVAGRVRDHQTKRQLTIEQTTGEHEENAFDTIKGAKYDGNDVIDAEQISPTKVTEAMQNFVNDLIVDEDDVIRYIDDKRAQGVKEAYLETQQQVIAAERKRSYLTGRVVAGTRSWEPPVIAEDQRSDTGRKFDENPCQEVEERFIDRMHERGARWAAAWRAYHKKNDDKPFKQNNSTDARSWDPCVIGDDRGYPESCRYSESEALRVKDRAKSCFRSFTLRALVQTYLGHGKRVPPYIRKNAGNLTSRCKSLIYDALPAQVANLMREQVPLP
jgi:hypothetical protein